MAKSVNKIFKKMMPRGLFVRSLLILITPITLVMLITSFVFVDNHWNRMSDRLAESVVGEIIWLSDMVESSRWDYTDIQGYGKAHLEIDITYDKAAILPEHYKDHGSWQRIMRKSLERALDKRTARPYRINIAHHNKFIYIKIGLKQGVITFNVPLRRIFSSSAYIFLIWMAISSIFLISIAAIFMRNQIRPIRALAKATENYGRGIDTKNFKPCGAREVRQAARAFLDMKDRIGRQVSQRTVMLAGVSHDLRTPLTRLKLSLSMLPPSQDIDDMKKDIADMETMIDGYLNFARGADIKEESARINFSALITEIYARNKNRLKPVHLDLPEYVELNIKPQSMERALTNILNNADKYGEEIWVSAQIIDEPYNKHLELRIEDNGIGIAPEKLEDVFKPFYRVETSRNSSTGGIGLGLSIAQDIILNHGGKITLDKSPHGGLAACIHLPI
jgi:two-component system osmolarity sensor histidine kinase EnvZ